MATNFSLQINGSEEAQLPTRLEYRELFYSFFYNQLFIGDRLGKPVPVGCICSFEEDLAHKKETQNDHEAPNILENYVNTPITFIESFYKIINIDIGIVPIKLFDAQKIIINTLLNNKFVICAGQRQHGKTTTALSYILWAIITKKNYNVAIVPPNKRIFDEIITRYNLAYDYLPFVFGEKEKNSGIKYMSADELYYGDLSPYDLIYVDEMASIDFPREQPLTNAISHVKSKKDAKLFISSTNEDSSLFNEYWKKSVNTENEFIPIIFNK